MGSLRAAAVTPMALQMAPGSFASSHPSTAAHPSSGFARSQTLPPRMPAFDAGPSLTAALVNNGAALNWLAAGGVDRLEGLRQVRPPPPPPSLPLMSICLTFSLWTLSLTLNTVNIVLHFEHFEY